MKRNKHLLLWSSLGTLALLIAAAAQEQVFEEWRVIQGEYARLSSGQGSEVFQPHLRQIVIPDLGVTDRCVTCHLGMAPGEARVAGHPVFDSHPDVVHDPGDYGCTVCHGGQGRATKSADAHGEVEFWPQPMIPARYSEAGCGSCHTHLKIPPAQRLQRGRALLERYDCLSCHTLDGRGGTLRTGAAAALVAPDLSRVGARAYDRDWLAGHQEKRRSGAPGWQDSFGEIRAADLPPIGAFLDSRVGAPRLIESKALFHSLGCRGCHPVNGVGGEDGPDLTLVGQKDPVLMNFSHLEGDRTVSNWLTEHLRAPARITAGSQMPYLGLGDAEIEKVTLYLFSLRRTAAPQAFWPLDRTRAEYLDEREFDPDGETLYRVFCAACHGPRGQGMRYPGLAAFPAIGNPDFLALASDRFIAEHIRRGRAGRRMPAWGEKSGGLRESEIDAIVAYLRGLGPATPLQEIAGADRWAKGNADEGARLYAAACAGCHGDRGEGGEGPALADPVLLETAGDTYLTETIRRGRKGTTMPSFETPSLVHRALTAEEIESVVVFIRSWEKDS